MKILGNFRAGARMPGQQNRTECPKAETKTPPVMTNDKWQRNGKDPIPKKCKILHTRNCIFIDAGLERSMKVRPDRRHHKSLKQQSLYPNFEHLNNDELGGHYVGVGVLFFHHSAASKQCTFLSGRRASKSKLFIRLMRQLSSRQLQTLMKHKCSV